MWTVCWAYITMDRRNMLIKQTIREWFFSTWLVVCVIGVLSIMNVCSMVCFLYIFHRLQKYNYFFKYQNIWQELLRMSKILFYVGMWCGAAECVLGMIRSCLRMCYFLKIVDNWFRITLAFLLTNRLVMTELDNEPSANQFKIVNECAK